MKKLILVTIVTLLFFVTNAQNPVKVSASQKVVIEKRIKDFCYYVEQISEGNSEGLAILRDDIIEQFANESWNDLTNEQEEITFDRYFKLISNNKIKVKFTKIPDRDDFLYYQVQKTDRIVPFVLVPITKKINNKNSTGYIAIRARTKKVINFKKELPEWIEIYDKAGNLINNNIIKPIVTNQDIILIQRIKNQKVGFVNAKNGNLIIPYIYEKAKYYYKNNTLSFFNFGFQAVKKDGKWGVINKQNKTILQFIYDDVRVEKGFFICKKNGKVGKLNYQNKTIIPFIYEQIGNFSEGICFATKNNKKGGIDIHGNVIIPFIYDAGGWFSEGVAVVKKNNEWLVINRKGNTIGKIKGTPEYFLGFNNGLLAVKNEGKWGFINKQMTTVVPYIFDRVDYYKNGISSVYKNGKYGIIDTKGEFILQLNFDEIFIFRDLIGIKNNNKWGFCDYNGNIVIPQMYDDIGIATVYSDLIPVKKNNEWFYINKDGKRIKDIK